MINMEEIRENIRELMFEFTNSDSTVEIDMKSPTEVDVELNGKFFNTYLVKEKKFKHNIVHETEQKSEFKMDIVIISPDISEEYKQYRGAPLQLPATEFEIKDALCRARVTDNGQVCRISECILYDKDIVGEFLARNKEVDLEELNYLAKVMSRFDKHEHELFKGYMAMKGPFVLSVKDLINAAYNLHCCDLTYDIDEDEMLGRYYADNGLLEWFGDARKEVWEFLDYTKLGRTIREKENGVYTESGYFVFNPNEYSTVYDGGEFPEKFINDGYIFKLLIAKSETGRAADGKWLSLPASKERKASFARELGAESLDECILLAVQSIECNMPMCITGLSQLGMLNSLAHRMRDMSKSGEFAKYMAVLEGIGFSNLDEAVALANSLQEYELYEKPSTIIEFAKDWLARTYKEILPESVFQHINFATYAEELITQHKLALSEYGIVKHIDKTVDSFEGKRQPEV